VCGINFILLSLPRTNKQPTRQTNKQTDIAHVKRIRNREYQTLETLINEEALLFAKYLRAERETWIPKIANSI